MDRRNFLAGLAASTTLTSLGCGTLEGAASPVRAPAEPASESAAAFGELLDTLRELERDWLQDPRRIVTPIDESDGYRNLLHMLEAGLVRYFETDPEWPTFHRLVTPTRKFMGDNPDAIYHGAFVRGDRRYRIRGKLAGAIYTSFTVEYGSAPGEMSEGVASVVNDSQFDVASDGSYELIASPTNETGSRNWIELPSNAVQISTRHYYETVTCAAADPLLHIPLAIEPLDHPDPPLFDDRHVASGIRRVARQLRVKTRHTSIPGTIPLPSWVGLEANHFPDPQSPGDIAYTALDASYTMAPYAIGPDEALVMTGRYPRCRFSNVVVWNAYQMTYDYAHRQTSLNRAQTSLEPDGSFRIILAHRDPGRPNWIDTEGRPTGTVFWRFFLPEEQPEAPRAAVVPFDTL